MVRMIRVALPQRPASFVTWCQTRAARRTQWADLKKNPKTSWLKQRDRSQIFKKVNDWLMSLKKKKEVKCTLGDERPQRSRRSLWCPPWLITFIFPLKTYIMMKGPHNLSRFSVWTSCKHIPQTRCDCLQKRWYESAWVQPCMKCSSFFLFQF